MISYNFLAGKFSLFRIDIIEKFSVLIFQRFLISDLGFRILKKSI